MNFLFLKAARLGIVLSVCAAFHANGQIGCQGTPSGPVVCNDPVPIVNLSGAWAATGEVWNVSASGGSAFGTVSVQNPAAPFSCPTIVYSVSGTLSPSFQTDNVPGFVNFSWNASNPNPAGACANFTPAPSMNYTGTVANKSNDRATGDWSRPLPGGGTLTGTFTLNKNPRDIPTNEITDAVGFSSGLLETVAQFRQQLVAGSGSSDIFKGRQVTETTGTGPNFDNCRVEGVTSVPRYAINNARWNVGYYGGLENWWVDDYIGWNTTQVNYYRTVLTPQSFPCGAQLPQAMVIAVDGSFGSTTQYKAHPIIVQLTMTTVSSTRDGVTQAKPWP